MNSAREEHVRATVQEWFNRVTVNWDYGPRLTLAETLRYALAVDDAIDTAKRSHQEVRPWLTDKCPECETQVIDMRSHEKDEHLILSGYVIIGCEWFWIVNPNVVGISVPEWSDWKAESN